MHGTIRFALADRIPRLTPDRPDRLKSFAVAAHLPKP